MAHDWIQDSVASETEDPGESNGVKNAFESLDTVKESLLWIDAFSPPPLLCSDTFSLPPALPRQSKSSLSWRNSFFHVSKKMPRAKRMPRLKNLLRKATDTRTQHQKLSLWKEHQRERWPRAHSSYDRGMIVWVRVELCYERIANVYSSTFDQLKIISCFIFQPPHATWE